MAYENDVIRNELARLTALVPVTSPYILPDESGYGHDTAVFYDSEADQRMIGGVESVVFDVSRRYITDRGTLPSDLDYGLSLVAFIHGGVVGGPRVWEQLVEHEALKDQRVVAANCVWTETTPGTHDVVLTLEIAEVNGTVTRQLVFVVTASTVEIVAQ